MSIDTRKVKSRRKVEFASLQDILADAERMSGGNVRTLGNWSTDQIFAHLAKSMQGSIDGSKFTAPWYFRLIGLLMKKRMLKGPMPPGFQLPPDAARELVPGPKSTEEGLSELHAAIARLERESKHAPNAVLGKLTKEEWDQLHCTHAALHMSFLAAQE
jgi:hypothetical protein